MEDLENSNLKRDSGRKNKQTEDQQMENMEVSRYHLLPRHFPQANGENWTALHQLAQGLFTAAYFHVHQAPN